VKQFLRLPRREVLIVVGAALLAFVITLAVLVSSGSARARRLTAEERQELGRIQKPPLIAPEDLALTPDDFLLPQTPTTGKALHYTPYRPRLPRWSEETVRTFWIPPRRIATEILRSLNDQNVRRLFEKVP
jgi:hypothetical protein